MADEGKVALTRGGLGSSPWIHSFSTGLTLRAGGFPQVYLLFSWGGKEVYPRNRKRKHLTAGRYVAAVVVLGETNMFGSKMLDIAIGMIYLYSLLSLICSSVNELIEHQLKNRLITLSRFRWVHHSGSTC